MNIKKQNTILGCFDSNGIEVELSLANYVQIELIGDHAKNEKACMLISKNKLDIVMEFVWYLNKQGYPMTYGNGKDKCGAGLKIHKLLNPNVEKGMVIDHINRNRLDNRDENLRICTPAENAYNRTKNIDKKYKGVRKTKTCWTALITKDGKKHEIKDLPDEKTAAKVYNYMADELFGQYAAKNVV
jgi:hypothetical protein